LLAVASFLRKDALVVDTARVQRRALESTVDADGYTRVRERFSVVAPVAGRLLRLEVTEGTPVRRGDVVARLTPLPLDPGTVTQARSRLDAAVAMAVLAAGQLRVADVALEQRRRDAARAHRLHEAGGIADRDLETCDDALADAEVEARGARERVRIAEADVRQARAALLGDPAVRGEMVLVRAPESGVVLRVVDASERIVPAGAPLLDVGNPAALEIVIDVLSDDALSIAPNALVRVRGWSAPARQEAPTVTGRVREIEPAAFSKLSALGVEERRVNVIIDFAGATPPVGDGYRVDVQVVTWAAPDVVSVPLNALVRQETGGEGGWTTWVVADGRAVQREVRLGHVGDGAAEVLAGLEPQDEVVLFPTDQLRPRLRVTPRRTGAG
jgi:HlyD family secretion protein